MKPFIYFTVLCQLACASCWAEDGQGPDLQTVTRQLEALSSAVAKLERTVAAQQGTIAKLQTENQALKVSSRNAPANLGSGPGLQALPAPASTSAGLVSGLSAYNPEIGVVADISAAMTQSAEDAEGNDKLSVREVELIFGHDIDPYSRLDATLTLGDFEDPTIEEAYVTLFDLPLGITGRLGRIRPRIGYASAIHRDQLDTYDMPLVVQKYLGAEGLFKTGAEGSAYVPVPWESVTHEVIAGVLEGGSGEEGTIFGENRRHPTFFTRLKNSVDLSDQTAANLGITWLTGSSDDDSSYEVDAFGVDGAVIHSFDSISKLKLQSEFYLQDRNAPFTETLEAIPLAFGEDGVEYRKRPWGFYSLVDLRMTERWGLGARYDQVEAVNLVEQAARSSDQAWSGYLTFFQSEFARWRAQYQHVNFEEGGDDNRFFLQGTFAIGVHKHKLQ